MPSRYVYILTNITDSIIGGAYYDNLVSISYGGGGSSRMLDSSGDSSGMIYDENGYELKNSTTSYAYLNPSVPFYWVDKDNAGFYGKLTLGFVSGTITFWFLISFVSGKTSLPCTFIFLAY